MEQQLLCPHCMKKTGAGERSCRYCGKELKAANERHQLQVGAILNKRYLVGSAIGGGGFGISYVGYDTLLNIRVAIKEYFPSGAAARRSDGEVYSSSSGTVDSFRRGKEQFLNEADVLAKFLDDGNVVRLLDFFETKGTAYIVMEYLEGQDLRRYMENREPLSFQEAVELLSPVMDCLGRIHAKGLIHGDISPSNIMLLKDSEIKLIDFGAARPFGSAGTGQSMLLKPGYAPEEQYRSNGELGPWTDVYAMSATLYRLICGETPLGSTDRAYKDELRQPGKFGAKLSPAQEQALLRGMSVKASSRPQSMAELKAELENPKAGLGGVFRSRGAKLIAAGAAAVLAVVVLLSAFGSPEKNRASSEKTGKDRTPQIIQMSEDAYPISLYAGMERLEGFEKQTMVDNEYCATAISDCFMGNGYLCLLLNLENRADCSIRMSVSLQCGRAGIDILELDSKREEIYEYPANSETVVSFWISTDLLYLLGMEKFDELKLNADLYTDDYDNISSSNKTWTVSFPSTIQLENRFNTEANTIYMDGKMKLEFCGLVLIKDYHKGLILLRASEVGSNIYTYLDVTVDGNISVDGSALVSDAYTQYVYIGSYYDEMLDTYIDYDYKYVELSFPYGYSSTKDEMNVFHSDTQFPEEIEIRIDIENDDEMKTSKVLSFAVDSEGIGRLVAQRDS